MEKRFIFRGNAVGVAGHIQKPGELIIWVQGASALPVVGGYSRSNVDRATFGDVLSFDSARTQATGDFSARENAYKTLADSVVKGLNVNGRLTADSLEATFTSTHPVDGSEPSIVPGGTQIMNLRIDGYPINVKLDIDLFTKYATRDSLSRAYSTDDTFFNRYGSRFQKSEKAPPPPPGKRPIPEVFGYIVTSIVSEIQTDHPKVVINGNMITLDGFGRIFLGELLITSISRRMTLVRLALGSEIGGDLACADIETNGSVIY
ncbi:MAG TPA: choice-of-anchor P family protein [Terriglobia bacterium]|nr:choice-of-anchor P family protein [Terriglobia bacterium]